MLKYSFSIDGEAMRKIQDFSREAIQEIALNFNSRAEFNRHKRSAYDAAKHMGIFDEVCAHMGPRKKREDQPRKWTKDKVALEAIKFSSRNDFHKNSASAYQAAFRYGWINDVCKHMGEPRIYNDGMTIDDALEEAQKYKTMVSFKEASPRHFWFLHGKKMLGVARQSMTKGWRSYDESKPGTVYLIEAIADFLDKPIYKVGVTNKSAESRIASIGIMSGVSAKVVFLMYFSDGQEALALERRIHAESDHIRHVGQKVSKRGFTEFYSQIPELMAEEIMKRYEVAA